MLRGEVDIIGSDHSPCPPDMKDRDNFFEIWGGIAGVQSTLPVLLDEGYYRRGLPLERIAALTSANGARRFGLATHRESRQISYLLDLEWQHRNQPNKPCCTGIAPALTAGLRLRGAIRHTIRRGEIIYSDGDITATSKGILIRPHEQADE